MITPIDLSSVLRRTVCELYSNLVTRPTGAAVRGEIELQLTELRGRTLTVIDFANVGLLDSHGDEVVAKPFCDTAPTTLPAKPISSFAVSASRISTRSRSVLERHGLAMVLQHADGGAELFAR